MKNRLLILCAFLIAFSGAKGFGLYFDFLIQETPSVVILPADSLGIGTNHVPYYSFYNVASLKASVYFSDDLNITARVKDTYIALTNSVITPTNQNSLYLDRAYLEYYSDAFEIQAGRALFFEGTGLIVGNVADGLFARTSFLGLNERFYVLYSGLLPDELNEFSVNPVEVINGADRLVAGLSLQRYGLFFKTLSANFYYNADLALDTPTNVVKNSFYAGISGTYNFGAKSSFTFNGYYEGGQAFDTNGVQMPLSAFAFDLKYQLLFGANFGAYASLAYASGDSDGEGMGRFNTPGFCDTGLVLQPDFSNLLVAKLNLTAKFFSDRFVTSLNYYYLMRPVVLDDVAGAYSGTGQEIGHELFGSVEYSFDANFNAFVDAAYFIEGDAFATPLDQYKVLTGLTIKL